MKTLKDILYVLDPSSQIQRVLRRAIVMGLITLVAESVIGYKNMVDPVYLPLLVAGGAALDKALRELL